MKKVANLVSRLPFIGKLKIGSLIFAFYFSMDKSERRQKYLSLMIFLVIFVLTHVVQLYAGIQAMSFHSPAWAKVISFLYAAANFGVVLTQTYLAFRSTVFFFKEKYPKRRRFYKEYSDDEIKTMFFVTLLGQAIFFIQYFFFK